MWLLITILFVGYVMKIERRKNKFDYFSPFNLLCIPTLALMILSYPQERLIGYMAVSQPAVFIFLYCIFFFWIGSRICCILYQKRQKRFHVIIPVVKDIPNAFIKGISFLFLAILVVNLNNILGSRSLLQLEDEEFANDGLVGHVGELIVYYIIYYLASLKEPAFKVKKVLAICLIIVFLVLKIFIAVKAQAVIPFVAGILFLIMRGYLKPNLKFVIIGFAGITTLFIIPALLFNTQKDQSFAFMSSYMVFYVYAGISGLTSFLIDHPSFNPGGAPLFVLRFFLNFFSKFFGDGKMERFAVAPGYNEVFTENAEFHHSSNVAMLFGEVYLNIGPILTAVFFIFLGIVFYLIYFSYRKHILLVILYSYIGANLVMSFFSSYIIGQTFLETCFFAYLLYFVAKMRSGKSTVIVNYENSGS